MFNGIDLSSDTATLPTIDMKKAMVEAELGDEQKGEDPTTKQLEETIAEILNFDQAIFFPSATMANQVALVAMSKPGDELIGAENCHLFRRESEGLAMHANVTCSHIATKTGIFTADDLEGSFGTPRNTSNATSRLISIENTTNLGGGMAWKKDELSSIVRYAKKFKLKLHMDGTRLFNASVKTGLAPAEIVLGFDAVTLCFSKGLGCPVGAALAFNNPQISSDRIRKLKYMMGGGMRQSGILAAAGIYALENHVTRLQADHEHASLLARLLTNYDQFIHVTNPSPDTNIVLFEYIYKKISVAQFYEDCINRGIRFSQITGNSFRAVTHLGIETGDITKAADILHSIFVKYEC